MAAVNFLDPDFRPSAMNTWQTLKPPTGDQTPVTVANIVMAIREASFTDANAYALCIEPYSAIRVMVLGEGSDTNAPVLDLYGWNDAGPGSLIGTVTATMTVVTPEFGAPGVHASIKKHFPVGTTWRTCDTYAATSDHEAQIIGIDAADITSHCIVLPTTQLANYPSFFTLDFSRSQFKFLVAIVGALGSATSAGAIFRPIGIKSGTSSPSGFWG